MTKNSFIIFSQLGEEGNAPQQLSLPSEQITSQVQAVDNSLQIEHLPDALQWWKEPRYWLIHKESKLRVPGSFTLAESQKIQEVSKDWDWSVESRDRRVACGLNLLALAEVVCKRLNQGGQTDG